MVQNYQFRPTTPAGGEDHELWDKIRELEQLIRQILTWKSQIASGNLVRATQIIGVIPPSSGGSGTTGSTLGAVSIWSNDSGGAVALGDYVRASGVREFDLGIDNDLAIGVLTENVATGADGHVRHLGYQAVVNTDGSDVAFEDFLIPSATSGKLMSGGATPVDRAIAIALGAGGAGAYDAAVLADAPVGYWKLDEVAGAIAADSSGNGLDGTIANGPTLGGPTAGITLDGVNQEITIPDDPLLAIFTGDFSLEAWVLRNTTGTDQSIMAKGVNSPQAQFRGFSGVIDAPYLLQDNTALAAHGTVIVNAVYHHIVITVSGSTYRIYIDGIDVSVQDATVTFSDTAFDLHIGSDVDGNGAQFLSADIKRAAVYASALSAGRVTAHFDAAAAGAVVPAYIFPQLHM